MPFLPGEIVHEVDALVSHRSAAVRLDQAEVAPLPTRAPLLLGQPALQRVRQVVHAVVNALAEPQNRLNI